MKTKFYGTDDQESISEITVKDAIKYELGLGRELPFTIYEWERANIDITPESILDDILTSLDEQYQSDTWTKPSKKMLKRAKKLIKVIKKEYIPFWLEKTGKKFYIDESTKKRYLKD